MKVLITGASGFLGRAVTRAVAASGHDVLALVRPMAQTEELQWPAKVSVIKGDLRQPDALRDRLADIDAVIHLAAAATGDLATQFSGTVVATENLLTILPPGSLKRFVHVSSFSVYDFSGRFPRGELTEDSPLETDLEERDPYTVTKLLQERLVREFCTDAGTPHVVLRPGAIYGPGKDWDCGRAFKLGRYDVIFSPFAKMRLTHVNNCADAIVKALIADVPPGSTFNIVDNDTPTHAGYHRMCRSAGLTQSRAIYLPWFVAAAAARSIAYIGKKVFRGRVRLPEVLAARRQQVRWRPLRYPNGPAKEALSWSPRVKTSDALREMVCDQKES